MSCENCNTGVVVPPPTSGYRMMIACPAKPDGTIPVVSWDFDDPEHLTEGEMLEEIRIALRRIGRQSGSQEG